MNSKYMQPYKDKKEISMSQLKQTSHKSINPKCCEKKPFKKSTTPSINTLTMLYFRFRRKIFLTNKSPTSSFQIVSHSNHQSTANCLSFIYYGNLPRV